MHKTHTKTILGAIDIMLHINSHIDRSNKIPVYIIYMKDLDAQI